MGDDIVTRSDTLDERIATSPLNVEESINSLVKASNRNRMLSIVSIVSVAFDIVLSIVLVFTVAATTKNSIKIEQTRAILLSNCEVGNQFRLENKQFWNYIISLRAERPMTPEQEETTKAFQAKLEDTFAERDCSTI